MKKAKKLRFLVFMLLLFVPMQAMAFSDLAESDTYYFELTYLKDEGVINGYDDGTVKPNKEINRAELIKVLVEGVLNNMPDSSKYRNCFPDVGTQWFAPYVCFAAEKGWVEGYSDRNFAPDKTVNKAEALKIILEAFDVKISSSGSDEWYEPYFEAAVEKNVFENQNFKPEKKQTRGEVGDLVAKLKQLAYMGDAAYTDQLKAEFQTLYLINKIRAENGITQKLKLNQKLTQVAREHAKDIAENIGGVSHKSSSGDGLVIRLADSGAKYSSGGENVGKASIGGMTIYDAIKDIHMNSFMTESDGESNHKSNILGTFYPFNEVGIGVYIKDNVMYFSVDFIGN